MNEGIDQRGLCVLLMDVVCKLNSGFFLLLLLLLVYYKKLQGAVSRSVASSSGLCADLALALCLCVRACVHVYVGG